MVLLFTKLKIWIFEIQRNLSFMRMLNIDDPEIDLWGIPKIISHQLLKQERRTCFSSLLSLTLIKDFKFFVSSYTSLILKLKDRVGYSRMVVKGPSALFQQILICPQHFVRARIVGKEA